MVNSKKADSASMRHKLRNNKTFMIHKHMLEAPVLPPPPSGSGFSKLKNLFSKGKSQKKEPELLYIKEVKEPEFLHEIDTEHYTREVEPELSLWLNDGRVIRSVEELSKALETLPGKAFTQHREKGEIKSWLKDVIGRPRLAIQFAATKNRRQAIKVLEKFVKAGQEKEKQEQEKTIQSEAEKAKQAEITEAIDRVVKKSERNLALEAKEQLLRAEEQLQRAEIAHFQKKEDELNERIVHLTKKKYALAKQKTKQIVVVPQKKSLHKMRGLPKLKLTSEYSKQQIQSLLENTRQQLHVGNINQAKKLVDELKKALDTADIEPEKVKKFEYDIMELDTDIKLATLV